MFDALFGKFAIQTSIRTPYSDDALLCIFALESSTNFRFQPDGFHFFLKNFLSHQFSNRIPFCSGVLLYLRARLRVCLGQSL